MKKIIFLVLSILLLSGCTDYTELNDLAIASSVAIDYENKEYKIIVQVLNSKDTDSSKNENKSIIKYKSNGKTLNEAFTNIQLECPKKLYLGHINTFIIKDELLKENTTLFIDFILRNTEIEKDFNILVTKDNLEEIMDIIPPLENIPANNIKNSIEVSSIYQGSVNNIYFDKFVSELYEKGIDPTLPIIYIKNDKDDKRIILSKEQALFKEDKLINYLDKDSSLGLNILKNRAKSSLITFKCDKDNYASVELLKISSNLKFSIKDNSLNINLDIIGSLNEMNCNNESKEKINIKFKDEINRLINKTIDNEINKEVDYLGIGKYIYQNNYNFYIKNNINDIIKNMKRNINIKTNITKKSSINKGDE